MEGERRFHVGVVSELTGLSHCRFLSFPKVLNDFQVFGMKFDGDLPIDGLVSLASALV